MQHAAFRVDWYVLGKDRYASDPRDGTPMMLPRRSAGRSAIPVWERLCGTPRA